MYSNSQNSSLLNQPNTTSNCQGYSNDVDQMNSQLQKIKNKWSEYNAKIETIHTDFLKVKETAAELFEYVKLHSEKVDEKDSKEEIEEKKNPGVVDSVSPKALEENSVKDNSSGVNKEKEEPEVFDPQLPEKIEETQKLLTYASALEMMAQKEKYFKSSKDSIKTKSKYFEDFHSILQGKLKRIENLSPEMFAKYEESEKTQIIGEISLSDSESKLHNKCCELYNEVIRDHSMLQVIYGLPEKSEENKVDEVEKKTDSCINLCKKLNLYSSENENTIS